MQTDPFPYPINAWSGSFLSNMEATRFHKNLQKYPTNWFRATWTQRNGVESIVGRNDHKGRQTNAQGLLTCLGGLANANHTQRTSFMGLQQACLVDDWNQRNCAASKSRLSIWNNWTPHSSDHTTRYQFSRGRLSTSQAQMRYCVRCRDVNRYNLMGLLLPYLTEDKESWTESWIYYLHLMWMGFEQGRFCNKWQKV